MVSERQRCSPTSISASVSKVLDDDDLLIEILLRLGFPTTLVLAAAVCRHWFHSAPGRPWFHYASDRVFLRRFRELHPPRLLGFYVNPCETRTIPCFVPMLPQPPEFASVIRLASSSLATYQSDNASIYIRNCRNGNGLIQHLGRNESTTGVHNLLCPDRGMAIVPRFQPPQPQDGSFYTSQKILSKEEESGGLSYLKVFARSIWSVIQLASSLYQPRSVTNIFGNWLNGIDPRFKKHIRVIYRCTNTLRLWSSLQRVEHQHLFTEGRWPIRRRKVNSASAGSGVAGARQARRSNGAWKRAGRKWPEMMAYQGARRRRLKEKRRRPPLARATSLPAPPDGDDDDDAGPPSVEHLRGGVKVAAVVVA
ncbi:hypothetical protein QYE76_024738 [Lolium multiflorum]|uniref:F-box protein AT5G49610-like beta-propeller domain-containing protein n=1 Tax=Lolium multiflorum TaxID=4521 RepID=A0AAD8VVB3_LOLMU|nr:hypothetical protein QYE76_024738 [Lolium multiflorum]